MAWIHVGVGVGVAKSVYMCMYWIGWLIERLDGWMGMDYFFEDCSEENGDCEMNR